MLLKKCWSYPNMLVQIHTYCYQYGTDDTENYLEHYSDAGLLICLMFNPFGATHKTMD